MQKILILLAFPAVCIIAFAVGGLVRAEQVADSVVVHGGEPPPQPLPEFPGMVYIPAGEFIMGTSVDQLYRMGEVDEFPQRRVWVNDYYMDIHEVTNAQYKYFLDSTKVDAPPRWQNGNYGIGEDGLPVVSITWAEASAYARFVGKRLPSEPEWEKAARGVDGRRYPWGDKFDPTLANNGETLMPVMSFELGKSPFGCYDMAGNAAEWVSGWYAAYPRGEDDVLPPDIPDRREQFRSDRRVYRGGSWNSFAKFLRCANRESTGADNRWMYVGFRCVMDPPWREPTP